MDQRKSIITICILFLCLGAQGLSAQAKNISVMSYNVQNLFDTKHDEGKNDFEFLPNRHPQKKKGCRAIKNTYYRKSCLQTNWTADKLATKIAQIKKVIVHSGVPHVVGLVEVENKNVVNMLAKELGYEGVVVGEGLDARGVDVALLYKKNAGLRFVKLREDKIEGTRSLLQATFLVGKKKLHFFVNHWPSQGSPVAARIKVANRLKKMMNKISHKDYIVAMGDFNVVPFDRPHPITQTLNAQGLLYDLSETIEDKNLSGTYFYPRKMMWDMFDRILISQNLKKKFSHYHIVHPDFITGVYEYRKKKSPYYGSRVMGIPKKFNFKAKSIKKVGFSDHFPVMVNLKL